MARGLNVIGLLGVLERAGEGGLLDLKETLERLPADYRIDRALLRSVMGRATGRGEARREGGGSGGHEGGRLPDRPEHSGHVMFCYAWPYQARPGTGTGGRP